ATWWQPASESIELPAGGGTRPGRVQETLERGHIDGDGDVGPHPRTGLHRAGIQVGPAQLHQCISTALGWRPAIVSSGDTDDAFEYLLDQLSFFVTQPAPDVGAIQHLGDEQLALGALLTPTPVGGLRIRPHRPCLEDRKSVV